MTRDEDFIGQLEDYLDAYEGVTPLPDAIRETVRAKLPSTKQIGPVLGLMRFPAMSNPLKIGIAAAAVGVAALLGFNYFNDQVGDPTGTPSPSSSPTSGELPDELRYVFLGPAKSIEGLPQVQAATVDFTGEFIYYAGRDLLNATATLAGPGQIRLVSVRTSFTGCEQGDEGTYPYSLSPGGTILTIGDGADDCAARATALPGQWLRSDCTDPDNQCLGNLEAGTYSSFFFEPRLDGEWERRFGAFTYTVPEGWASYGDFPNSYGLTTQAEYAQVPSRECFDCPGTRDLISLLSDPGPATLDCLETNAAGVGDSATELADWFSSHPGMVVSGRQETTVGGLSATVLDLQAAADWTGTCDLENPFVAVPVFYRPDSYHWALPAGDRWHMILVDIGEGHTVVIVADTDPANFDAFVAEVTPIIDSFEFPTP